MINTTVSPDAVNSTSAISAADMGIFACQQQVPCSWVAAALICMVLIGFLTKGMFASIMSPVKKYSPLMNNDEVWNLSYLEESLRLSEAMMSEFSSTLKSHERKALMVITGAVALIGFIATKNWCAQAADYFGMISIIFCTSSVLPAISIITLKPTSFIGVSPDFTYNRYSKIKCVQPLEQSEKDRKEMCLLYTLLLKRYDMAVPIMLNVAGKKARKLAFASLCIVIGFVFAVGWLALKMLPTVL